MCVGTHITKIDALKNIPNFIKNMVKNFLYILLSISLQISSAEVPAEVKSALHSGSARLVSNVTERVIIQTIDAKTLNEESLNSLLENKDIEHVCYINRFF